MEIKQVGVVGAGQMGNGIAHVFALAGYDVLMTDIAEDSLAKALAHDRPEHRTPGRARQGHARGQGARRWRGSRPR